MNGGDEFHRGDLITELAWEICDGSRSMCHHGPGICGHSRACAREVVARLIWWMREEAGAVYDMPPRAHGITRGQESAAIYRAAQYLLHYQDQEPPS